MNLSGTFSNHPELLEAFQDEDAEIISASNEAVVYSDGFTLENPLQPLVLEEDTATVLFRYLQDALDSHPSLPEPGVERFSLLMGLALEQWSLDLQHRFNEWPGRGKAGRLPAVREKIRPAVQFALAHKSVPLQQVARQFRVRQGDLILGLRAHQIQTGYAQS